MLTDLNDTHIIQIKRNRSKKMQKKYKIKKKERQKPTHTHTVGTAPQTKRKIVERCTIDTSNTQHGCLHHGENGVPGENHRPVASH